MIVLRSVSLRSRATGAQVLSAIDWQLADGQIALATGSSGCGKTALCRLLYAAARPDEGQVLVFGHNLAKLRASSLPLLRRKVAVIPQEISLIERETTIANAAAGLMVSAVPRQEAYARAARALELFGIAELAKIGVSRLSSGQRRRVCLARAAAIEPTIVIADDPTAHLDGAGRAALVEFLSHVAQGGGASIVASSNPAMAAVAMRLDWQVFDLEGAAPETLAAQEPVSGNVVPFPQSGRMRASAGSTTGGSQ